MEPTITKEYAIERWNTLKREIKRLGKRLNYLYDWYYTQHETKFADEITTVEKQLKLYEQEQHELGVNYSIIDGELVNDLLSTWYYSNSFTLEEIELKLVETIFKKVDDTKLTWTFLYKCDLNSCANCNFVGDKTFADLLKSKPKEFAKFIKYVHWKHLHKDDGIPYDMKHVFSYLCGDSRYIEGCSHCLGFGKHWYIRYNNKGQCYEVER